MIIHKLHDRLTMPTHHNTQYSDKPVAGFSIYIREPIPASANTLKANAALNTFSVAHH